MTPSDFIGDKATYDKWGDAIIGHKGNEQQILLDVRGWGAIRDLFPDEEDASKFQDDLGAWIADAINEKLDRERSNEVSDRPTIVVIGHEPIPSYPRVESQIETDTVMTITRPSPPLLPDYLYIDPPKSGQERRRERRRSKKKKNNRRR